MKLREEYKKEIKIFNLTLLLRPIIVFFCLSIGYYFLKDLLPVSPFPFIWIFLSSLFISILFYISAKKGKKFLLTHLFADIALIIGIMHFTGGPESAFSILFFLVIIMASLFLERDKFFLFSVNLIIAYNIFLFLWTTNILKTPFELEIAKSEMFLRGYIFTLSFIIASFLSYILSERARRGEKRALRADFLAKEILKNLGEIVVVRNKNKEVLFSNSNLPENFLKLIEKNPKIKEIVLNSSIFSLNYKKFPLFDDEIEIFVLRDITKEREMEEIIKQKEKEKFLTELSQGLAHEIRNPLGAIQGAFSTLSKVKDKEKKEKLLNLIKKEIERLNSMVNVFSQYAKIKKINKEKIPLKIFVSNIANEFKVQNLHFENTPEFIECDPYLMKIAISNLLRNAIEAVDGDITKVRIEIKSNNSQTEISIKDEGPGINEEEIEKIKYPFYTTKTGGMGMGLPLADRIAELHGFKLKIESKKGKGTEAKIVIK